MHIAHESEHNVKNQEATIFDDLIYNLVLIKAYGKCSATVNC